MGLDGHTLAENICGNWSIGSKVLVDVALMQEPWIYGSRGVPYYLSLLHKNGVRVFCSLINKDVKFKVASKYFSIDQSNVTSPLVSELLGEYSIFLLGCESN